MAKRDRANAETCRATVQFSRKPIALSAFGIGWVLIAGLQVGSRTAIPAMHLLLDLGLICLSTALLYAVAKRRHAAAPEADSDGIADRERSQRLIDASLDGVWDWDLDRQTLYLSPRWKEQLGYQDHELKNCYDTWRDLLHSDDRDWVIEQLGSYLASPTELWECEYRLLHRQGGHRWILSRASPVHRETGKLVRLLGVHIDITERKRSEQRLREAAAVFDGTNEGIVVTDGDGNVLLVNPAFSRITGYAPSEIVGLRPNVLKSGRHDEDFYRAMWAGLQERGAWQGEIWNRRKNGEIYPEWLSISRLSEGDDGVRYVGQFTDISTIKHTEQRLEYLAHHDALTDLPNRLLLDARLEYALTRTSEHESLALLFIDLDAFKQINDRHGHQTGDLVLRTVAERLLDSVRQEDTVARLGGDEFVALIEAPVEPDEISKLVRRIQAAIEAPITSPNGTLAIKISASIGVSLHSGQGETADRMLDIADRAMYRAKASRKCAMPPLLTRSMPPHGNTPHETDH